MTQRRKRVLVQLSLLASVFLISMGIFTLSYRYDNKYRRLSLQPVNGLLMFYEPDQGPIHLINGWEYYRGKLLEPEDFADPALLPDGHLAIGRFSGMEAGDPDASPHGSITYRLTLCLPDAPASYTLELPEIYSAYRLYVNDRLAASQGNPEPSRYSPAIRAGSLTFTASGDVTLLLSVSDWSHLYSGLVYPPAFGASGDVQAMLDHKFVWGLAAVILALVLGLFQLIPAVLQKSRRSLLSGLICTAFAVSVCSPVVHRLITTGAVPFYAIEIFCRYAIYGLSVMLVHEICTAFYGEKKRSHTTPYMMTGRSLFTAVTLLAAAFPFLAALVSLMAPVLSRQQMILFSHASAAYKLFCAAWLLGTVFYEGLHGQHTPETNALLAGICVFASSLAADRLYPDFEPVRFGWFSETAGLIFVLIVSCLILHESLLLYRKQFILTSQIEMQKKHYMDLAGQVEAVRTMRHDIRHHLTQLSLLLADGKEAEAKKYLEQLNHASLSASPLSFCDAYYVDVLLRYYDSRARDQKVPLSIEAQLPANPGIPEDDLCVILGNLLENSLEACALVPSMGRFLSIVIKKKNHALAIEMKNSYTGSLLPDGENYYSTKEPGRRGIGLSSIRQTVQKYNGSVWITTDPGENGINTFSVKIMMVTKEPGEI